MIRTSQGRELIRIDNATIPDIISTIRHADQNSAKFIGSTQKLIGPTKLQTYKNIWNWIRLNIRYKADGKRQVTKSPAYLYSSRVGDCKSMAVMTGAILQKMCIPYNLIVDFYDESTPNQGHVYVRTKDGVVIDPVNSRFNQNDQVWKRDVYEGNYICSINGKTPSANYQPQNNLICIIISLLILRELIQ